VTGSPVRAGRSRSHQSQGDSHGHAGGALGSANRRLSAQLQPRAEKGGFGLERQAAVLAHWRTCSLAYSLRVIWKWVQFPKCMLIT